MLLARVATNDTCVLLSNTADDERRLFRTAVLGTEEQRLAHIVAAFLKGDGDTSLAARVVGTAPFTGLSQGIGDAFSLMDDNVSGICITAKEEQKEGHNLFHLVLAIYKKDGQHSFLSSDAYE